MKMFTATAVVVALGLATQVTAQQSTCAPRAAVVERLASAYGESLRTQALNETSQYMIETFASESGTWTVTATDGGGNTCMVASGHSWVEVNEPLPPQGDEM